MPHILSPKALCKLQDVKEYNNIPPGDTDGDATLIRLINAVSGLITQDCHREIVNPDEDPSARSFDIEARMWMASRGVWEVPIGDLKSPAGDVSMTLTSELGASLGTVTGFTPLPRVRTEAWQPITKIRLPRILQVVGANYVLTVTANWGFPEIPDFVTQACIVGVSISYAKDVERWSETFGSEANRLVIPGALPTRVRNMYLPRLMRVPA